MSDEQNGLPAGWVIVDDHAPPASVESPPNTKGLGLPLAAAGEATKLGGRLVQSASDVASRVRVNPSTMLDQFSLNQPQKILKGVSLAGKNPMAPESAATSFAKRVAPYGQTLSTLGIVQGALDLHQMAEPNRKDIGFMGIGTGTPDPEHPALLNMIVSKLRQRFGI